MNAVIYARYSSDRQREESIEGQLRECTDYAMKNNLTLLGTYVDRALSARTADRPDFQRMIADSAKGLFDVVLVWKLDRFSRDRYDSAHYKHVLKKNGVRVISIKENISDGPEGIILESMLEGYAEYYSAELAQKIRRGQHDNAMKCMNNGGNTPLGYTVDKKSGVLVINPATAPVVQEIFTRYANGDAISNIQKDLEARGVRSRRGNAYTVSVLSNLLKNRKYIGEYKYGDVITPDGIPAIIDKELFERVQMRMAANKKAPARAKAEEEYLLTTKLYCGDCGRLMAGESGKGCKGIVYHYYKCSGAKRRLGCKKKAIKKHWIEETVVKLTVSKVLTDEAIDRIADAILVMQEQGDTMTPVLKQQLQQCEAEIRNVMKAIRQGIITETTKECLEDLETQRDSLKASILQLQLERRKFTKEEIVEWISKYKYGNINDLDYRKEIIDTFVNSVFVYDDKLVLTYNYKDGTETLTLQEIESVLSSNLTSMCPPKKTPPNRVVSFCSLSVLVFQICFSAGVVEIIAQGVDDHKQGHFFHIEFPQRFCPEIFIGDEFAAFYAFCQQRTGTANGTKVDAGVLFHSIHNFRQPRALADHTPCAYTHHRGGIGIHTTGGGRSGRADDLTGLGRGGAYIVNGCILRIKRQRFAPCQCFTHPLVTGIPGGVDGACEIDSITGMKGFCQFFRQG